MRGLGIKRQDILDAAILFAGFHATFRAKDFAEFLTMQSENTDEEAVDEILGEFADTGKLRRIGPGVYAKCGAA